jgi:hypothetical protein
MFLFVEDAIGKMGTIVGSIVGSVTWSESRMRAQPIVRRAYDDAFLDAFSLLYNTELPEYSNFQEAGYSIKASLTLYRVIDCACSLSFFSLHSRQCQLDDNCSGLRRAARTHL